MAVGDIDEHCSPSDLAPALRRSMDMFQQILASMPDNYTSFGDSRRRDISLLECEGILYPNVLRYWDT